MMLQPTAIPNSSVTLEPYANGVLWSDLELSLISNRSPFCSQRLRSEPDKLFDPLVRDRVQLLEKQLVGLVQALLPFVFPQEYASSQGPNSVQWKSFMQQHNMANNQPGNKILRTVQALLRKSLKLEEKLGAGKVLSKPYLLLFLTCVGADCWEQNRRRCKDSDNEGWFLNLL